ncbi:MAG: AbrB/MazE/SpoVT family DNA-binding domain-containing protein [Desulfobacterales bacterium]|jgi:hypothetical protein
MASNHPKIHDKVDKIRQMIEQGRAAKEITTEFGISPYMLVDVLIMLQELDRKVYLVSGLFDFSGNEKSKFRKEGIVFHREVLEKIGFQPGDAFEMRASGNRIVLEKISKSGLS